MNFTLYSQLPKPSKPIVGTWSLEKDVAYYFRNDLLVRTLKSPRIEFAGADAIKLVGFEHDGFEPNGRAKYKYQEWLLKYPTGDAR